MGISIEELRKLLKGSRGKHKFYSKIYSELDIEDIQDMGDFHESVPTISKNRLLEYFEDGNFDFGADELNQPVYGRTTSGTTGDMACFYRTERELDKHYSRFSEVSNGYVNNNGKDRVMVTSSFSLAPIIIQQFKRQGCVVIAGNPYDLETTAETIARVGCNFLVASPAVMLKLAELLHKRGYESFEKTLLISNGLSPPTENKIRQYYPDLNIILQYGLAETGILMYQCDGLQGTNKYHRFHRDFYYEFVNMEGKLGRPGDVCELIVTKLSGMPLIRYKTGDLFEIQDKCSCGERIYRMMGRKEDSFKIRGVTLFKDRVEEAIEPVKKYIREYQLVIGERRVGEMPKPKLTLRVEMDEERVKGKDIEKKISKVFSENFQIAEDYNWKKGVDMGLFAEVEVEPTEFDERKIRRIVDERYG